MTDLTYPSIVPRIEKDRRTALIVFGIFALVIGGLSACFAMLTPLGMLMANALPRQPGMQHVDIRSLIGAVLLYGVVAATFIAGGVGAIRARRWARPLMLSVAWTWLLIGVFGMVMWVIMAPQMTQMMTGMGRPGAGTPPPGFARTMVVVMSVLMAVLYLVLPGVFILFFRSPHVRTTLEHYDPEPGWADRAPVSVFGLSVGLAVSALFTLTMLAYGFFPLFGTMLTGFAGAIATLAVSALFGLAAWLVFRLSPAGWWLTLLISIVLPVAMIVSHYLIGAIAMYEQMKMPPEQIDLFRGSAALNGPLIPICMGAFGAAGIVYLMAVRKFFVAVPGASAATAAFTG